MIRFLQLLHYSAWCLAIISFGASISGMWKFQMVIYALAAGLLVFFFAESRQAFWKILDEVPVEVNIALDVVAKLMIASIFCVIASYTLRVFSPDHQLIQLLPIIVSFFCMLGGLRFGGHLIKDIKYLEQRATCGEQ